MAEPQEGWIGVDLDGTLAHYDRWRGIEHIGAPVEKMVERVKATLAKGFEVRVFTARVCADDPEVRSRCIRAIHLWCAKFIGVALPVTNVKDFGMLELWDDRCVQVVPNTGEFVGTSTRGFE